MPSVRREETHSALHTVGREHASVAARPDPCRTCEDVPRGARWDGPLYPMYRLGNQDVTRRGRLREHDRAGLARDGSHARRMLRVWRNAPRLEVLRPAQIAVPLVVLACTTATQRHRPWSWRISGIRRLLCTSVWQPPCLYICDERRDGTVHGRRRKPDDRDRRGDLRNADSRHSPLVVARQIVEQR
jgi:hypothetical protein